MKKVAGKAAGQRDEAGEFFLLDEYLKIVQFLKKKQDAWRPVFLYDTIRRAVDALPAGVVQT